MQRFTSAIIILAIALAGCLPQKELPVEPESQDQGRLYGVKFQTTPPGSSILVYNEISGQIVFQGTAPCTFSPGTAGDYQYRVSRDSFDTRYGGLLVIPDQKTDEQNLVLYRSAVTYEPPAASLITPDTVDANVPFEALVNVSGARRAFMFGTDYSGPVPFMGSVQVRLNRSATIALWAEGPGGDDVAMRYVHVRGAAAPPAPTAELAGPTTVGKNEVFAAMATTSNAIFAFLGGANGSSGPIPINRTSEIPLSLESSSRLYLISLGENGQSATDSLYVSVPGTQPPLPPTLKVTALTPNIEQGQAARFIAQSANADYGISSSGVTSTVFFNSGTDTVTVYPLQAGTHAIRFRAFGPGGTVEQQAQISVTAVQTVVLYPPLRISPANNALDVPVRANFAWNRAANATAYDIEVYQGIQPGNLVFSRSNLADTAFTLQSDLMSATQYSWRVRSRNADGASNWPDVWRFTTVNPAANVTLTLAVDPDTIYLGETSNVSWSSTGADEVVISGYPGFGQVTLSGTQPVTPAAIGTYTFRAEAKQQGVVYVTREAKLVVIDKPKPPEKKLDSLCVTMEPDFVASHMNLIRTMEGMDGARQWHLPNAAGEVWFKGHFGYSGNTPDQRAEVIAIKYFTSQGDSGYFSMSPQACPVVMDDPSRGSPTSSETNHYYWVYAGKAVLPANVTLSIQAEHGSLLLCSGVYPPSSLPKGNSVWYDGFCLIYEKP